MQPIIKKENILFDVKAKNKEEMINQMVGLFSKGGYLSDKDQFRKDVLAREEIFPTYIGFGIGVPHGKSKGVTAKIIASYIFATLVFTIYLIFAIGTIFLMFGTDGGNLPIQLSNILSPYALTFFQSLLYNIVISYTVLFGMVGLTLFLSSKLKNPMTVLVIDIAIIMLPVFLSIKSAFGILNKILFLMPYNAIYSKFSQMVSYKLGNIVIDLPMMTIITYIFMMVIALICAKKTYSKHQVE